MWWKSTATLLMKMQLNFKCRILQLHESRQAGRETTCKQQFWIPSTVCVFTVQVSVCQIRPHILLQSAMQCSECSFAHFYSGFHSTCHLVCCKDPNAKLKKVYCEYNYLHWMLSRKKHPWRWKNSFDNNSKQSLNPLNTIINYSLWHQCDGCLIFIFQVSCHGFMAGLNTSASFDQWQCWYCQSQRVCKALSEEINATHDERCCYKADRPVWQPFIGSLTVRGWFSKLLMHMWVLKVLS